MDKGAAQSGSTFPDTIDLGDNDGNGPNGASPIAFLAGGTRGVQILPGGDFGRPAVAESSLVSGVVGAGDVNGDGSSDMLLRIHNTATLDQEHALIFGGPFLPEVLVVDSAGIPALQRRGLRFPGQRSISMNFEQIRFRDGNERRSW